MYISSTFFLLMQQKEVLIIVGVLVVGFFLLNNGMLSSLDTHGATGNFIAMTRCEDPCRTSSLLSGWRVVVSENYLTPCRIMRSEYSLPAS